MGLLLALEPFEPYDAARADELLDILDELPESVIAALKIGTPVDARIAQALNDASFWWASCEPRHDDG